MVGVLYSYDVQAKDPDKEDTLTYSLVAQPSGMRIDSITGLIQWTPTENQKTTHNVMVRVVDSNSTPASATQEFEVSVNPTPPKSATLAIVDGYDQRTRKKLSVEGTTNIVRDSDDKRQEIQPGSYISYDFAGVTIPPGASVSSVVVYVEHYEEEQFIPSKMKWSIGTGWPNDPNIWVSINAPIRKGQKNEAVDSLDITSFVDTPEKVKSLELQISNNDISSRKTVLINNVYVVVGWDWPAPQEIFERKPESDLVKYEIATQ
jgi:hypothetical protein